jgi:hypothetical protein
MQASLKVYRRAGKPHVVRIALSLVLLACATGCGVIVPYMYDAGKLDDRLAVAMSREQVLKSIGRPDRVVQDGGRQLVWEYRLYAKDEWKAYLIHCPVHPFCYFPAEPPSPYYVALQDDQLCMWGTMEVVRTLAWKICGTGPTAPYRPRVGDDRPDGRLQIFVIPVFMPPALSSSVQRLAVVPPDGIADDLVTSWLDLTLNFLRSRRPRLVLVEREALQSVMHEVGIQYSGRVDDDTTVRIGKLVGADSLLLYRLTAPAETVPVTASFELRLITVENGTTLFRQITTATGTLATRKAVPASINRSDRLARRLVIEETTAYGLAALLAAFGENPLGIVPDHTWTREGVKVLGLLDGGPAYLAGLKPGDRILACNGRAVQNWTEPISLPALLSVERDGQILEKSTGN